MSGSKRKTSKRASGEGTFEQLPSGKWRCYTRLNGQKVSGKAKTTREAAALDLRRAIAENEPGRVKGQSFTTFARNWLASKSYSPTTAEQYSYILDGLEKDILGQTPVGLITNLDLRTWKRKQKHAPATMRNRCSLINQILADAGSTARIEVPKKTDHTRRPLTPNERTVLKNLIAKAPEHLRLAVLICSEMGLRRSEACALKHEDRDGNGVWVRRSVLITQGKLHVKSKGKTARSYGRVPIPPSLREVIGSDKGWVIVDYKDPRNPKNPKVLYNEFKELIKGSILEDIPKIGLHALRRTYGQVLLETGADVVTAAKSMRHDPTMLLKEYSRTRTDLMEEAVERAFGIPDAPSVAPQKKKRVPSV